VRRTGKSVITGMKGRCYDQRIIFLYMNSYKSPKINFHDNSNNVKTQIDSKNNTGEEDVAITIHEMAFHWKL